MADQDYLNMSDEDIENAPEPTIEDETDGLQDEEEDNQEDSSEETEIEDEDLKEEEESEESEEVIVDDEPEVVIDSAETTEERTPYDTFEDSPDVKEEEEVKEPITESVKDSSDSAIDYKSEYEKIFSPIKANGKEIQMQNSDDVVSLIQKGANYNLKMNALKPHLRLLKTLEKNDLLDETKINYLIDLDKKDPKAVAKAVRDSGIDPLDINVDEDEEYTPNTYGISDSELELNDILEELKTSESGSVVLNTVGAEWDESSRAVFAETPAKLYQLEEQVKNGVFDTVMKAVEHEKVLGNLKGMSDIDAYQSVGSFLMQQGAFKHLMPETQETNQPIPIKSKQKTNSTGRNNKRKAAALTKSKPAPKKTSFDPLGLSDEEFEKMASSQYM